MSELAVVPSGGLIEWESAADRAIAGRSARMRIIEKVLVSGDDYGLIPGVLKPCLFKPGAEKVIDGLNLYPDYEPINVVEDFDRPLFFYRYRCILRQRGSEAIVATGIGSCNSREAKYRWRDGKRKCPLCEAETIFKSKKEPGWFCWEKKGGCGAQFTATDPAIIDQEIGRVENDDLASVVNTIDKMAQKRALVAATLNLGFSEKFTQDVEDMNGHIEEDAPPQPQARQPKQKAVATPQPRQPEPPADDEPPHPADVAATQASEQPMAAEVVGFVWIGTPIATNQKPTSTGGTKYGIKGKDDDGNDIWFNTFSSTVAVAAIGAQKGKEAIKIEYTTGKWGNDIVRLHTHDRVIEGREKK